MIINVKTNVDAFRRAMGAFQDQVAFATARALNDTADAARKAVTAELPDIFDRPVPFTMRAVRVETRASKKELRAVVNLQPIQAQYLLLEETGGVRTGAMNTLSPATALIEPQKIRANRYGNIPAGALARLKALSLLTQEKRKANVAARLAARAGRGRGKGSLALASTRSLAPVYSGVIYLRGADQQAHGRPGGYYRLSKGKLIPLITFAASAHYQPRFNFHARIGVVVKQNFADAMSKRTIEAVKTAR